MDQLPECMVRILDWVSISKFGKVQGQDTGSAANLAMKPQTSNDVDIAARSEGERRREGRTE